MEYCFTGLPLPQSIITGFKVALACHVRIVPSPKSGTQLRHCCGVRGWGCITNTARIAVLFVASKWITVSKNGGHPSVK